MGTSPVSIDAYFGERKRSRVILEAEPHPWISWRIAALGHEVVVGNPSAVCERNRKKHNDDMDAGVTRPSGKSGSSLLHPIRHRGPEVQAHLRLNRGRDQLVPS